MKDVTCATCFKASCGCRRNGSHFSVDVKLITSDGNVHRREPGTTSGTRTYKSRLKSKEETNLTSRVACSTFSPSTNSFSSRSVRWSSTDGRLAGGVRKTPDALTIPSALHHHEPPPQTAGPSAGRRLPALLWRQAQTGRKAVLYWDTFLR
ncbi:hypothetical protein E2C01_036011 [Portunus trituberculatus]|uniref:Uncharacterized protein n=1 Tax=Portunus trituberculatus TaxID=210409 RepID=A0A5B7F4P2_PORTR|nr:hypothetical protein [Portunus trituberculatus]